MGLQPVNRLMTLSAAAGAVGALGFGASAAAQEAPADIAWSMGAEGVVAAGAFDGQGVEPEGFVARAEAWASGNVVLDNQVELGAVIGLTAERDHPRADPRGDAISAAVSPTVRGVHSALAVGGPAADRGPRAQLETAYLYAASPWGRVSVGRQQGIAASYGGGIETGPRGLSAANPQLDLTGLGGPTTRDSLSGPSAKVTISTARVLGVELGASYTPDLEAAGVDQAKHFATPGAAGAAPRSVVEVGASLSLRPPGWIGIEAAATFSQADGLKGTASFGDIETTTASAGLVGDDWSVGVSSLRGDNGWTGAEAREYRATSIKGSLTTGDWALGLEIATSSDDLTKIDENAAMLTASTPVGEGQTLVVGLQSAERTSPGVAPEDRVERATGIFVGWTWAL